MLGLSLKPNIVSGHVAEGSPAPKRGSKFANTSKNAAQSTRRFDIHLDHRPILRKNLNPPKKSKGNCVYCGTKGTAIHECRTCGVALHYPSGQFQWPCADYFHKAHKKCCCWADRSAAEKKDFVMDPDVAVIKAQVHAAHEGKEVVSPMGGGGRKVARVSISHETKPAARKKAKGRGAKKNE